ncbi:MAG: M48 family metalloprotease, partial [Elusimicrobia bacterium]|nr:M48 family metalloprotease [Elusimicrobiota bacterium]
MKTMQKLFSIIIILMLLAGQYNGLLTYALTPAGQTETEAIIRRSLAARSGRTSAALAFHQVKDNDSEQVDDAPVIRGRRFMEELHLLESDYGFLPDGHPAYSFIQSRLKMLLTQFPENKKPRVEILASVGENISARVYPNGTVIISPELIQCINYSEELDFVILHELNHWYRLHHEETNTYPHMQSLIRKLGLDRYQEYEADIAAFFQMMDMGLSGQAAISFLERIKEHVQKHGYGLSNWDLIHGSLTDRILNLKSFSYLVELYYLDAPLTPMPDTVYASLENLSEAKGILKLFGTEEEKISEEYYEEMQKQTSDDDPVAVEWLLEEKWYEHKKHIIENASLKDIQMSIYYCARFI